MEMEVLRRIDGKLEKGSRTSEERVKSTTSTIEYYIGNDNGMKTLAA